MLIRSIFCVLLFCSLSTFVKAQQIFKISQYTEHNFLYNPAASGANSRASVGGLYRTMWSGMPGSPTTAILYGDKYFSKKKIGVSAAIYSDKTGPSSRSGGIINLSYSVELANQKRLMFGLGGQVLQFKIDKSEIADAIPGDALLNGSGTTVKGDASAGIYFKSPTLNVGVSVMQLIQTKLNLIKGTSGEDNQGKLYRHYFLMANYNWKTDEDNVLVPNILFKYLPNSPLEFEGGVRLEHKKLLWVGFNYHYQQEVTGYAGFNINKNLSLGYSFDIYNTPLNVFYSGHVAHEISMRYFFGK
ncbi:MAG: PorP/SprF family type IX secretion system membrane protein [Bacteroidota bacterium]